MIQLLVAISLFSSLLGIQQGRPPSGAVEVQNARVEYRFGKEITVQARLKTDLSVSGAFIFFQFAGGSPETQKITLEQDGDVRYRMDLSQRSIAPFERVYYWFRVEFADGGEAVSPSFWFDYEDNRFEWQSLEDGLFQAFWYEGDTQFGQQVLTTARNGLTATQKLFPVSPPSHIRLYVYASPSDLQSAIDAAGQTHFAGLADPNQATVMVSIQPGQDSELELERQIPHELAHLLLYQAAGQSGYAQLPAWLSEGLASLSELYPDADYERTLQAASKADLLIPLDSLCAALPQDQSTQFLAYAQSASFTRFLHFTYGLSGMQSLVQAYANGASCDAGLRQTFNASLLDLESRWQEEELGGSNVPSPLSAVLTPLQGLIPYAVLFVLVLVIPLFSFLFIRGEKASKSLPKSRTE
ncbi:MAG TPA: peptidase MA family metallohydrolase [Anaerolineaceae bacterium]|nr:peptidase MA family metallohydrolase [Anaerolineaceae bacterium]